MSWFSQTPTEVFVSWGMSPDWAWGLSTILNILLIALPLMLAVAMIIYADRKIWAAMALRRGPNVVGPFGLLQPLADGLKLLLKETIIPAGANRVLFVMAPMLTFILAMLAWAVIPVDKGWVLSDINVGVLYRGSRKPFQPERQASVDSVADLEKEFVL